jgi:hypothetical protein
MSDPAECTYLLRHRLMSSVPLLELYPGDSQAGALPLAVLLHGLRSCKERKLQHAYLAAAAGFFVLIPDASRHGERLDQDFAALSEEEGGTLLVRITGETARDLHVLTERYREDPRVRPDGVSLIGTSMGGMVIYEYLRRFGTGGIASAVPIISSPAWKEMTDYIREQNPRFNEVYSPEVEREVAEADPREELLSSLCDLPLLMLNAEDDELMPIESVRRFHRELRRRYRQPDLLGLQSFAEHGHVTSEEMMQASVQWALRHAGGR